ncbi:MAG: histidine kinase N-terminal 7TM domain-containing protein [Anaerolineales bacterium]
MTSAEAFYLFPYFLSLAISLGIFFYTWSKKTVQGAYAFAFYTFGQTVWIIGFILGLISNSLIGKLFWDDFQWLGSIVVIISLPIFVLQYTETKVDNPRRLFVLSWLVPGFLVLFLATDPIFHWVHNLPHLSTTHYYSELVYRYTPIVVGYAIYIYAITIWCLVKLLRRAARVQGLYRIQAFVISIGIIVPIFGTIFPLLGIYIGPQLDITPITATVGNLIIAWGVYRFRIFNVTPIARDKVFEAMVEPVVILDNQNNIVDINSSMLALLGKSSEDVIGEPARIIFDDFPIPIKMYTQVSYARAEATFTLGGKNIYYELTVWPMFGTNKEMTGRIYISHDITAMKELENELRKLNAELEDRVRARTWELADAYDTTLEGWARALELRDKETEGHSRRVTNMTLKLAQAMNIDGEDLEQIRRGAILHDIGKMGIPDEILHKPGKLTEEEREVIKKHPEIAYKLLAPIPFLKKALDIPYYHHEKWNGTGYPHGLRGEEIPLSARIFAIADVWDALSSDRPYNKAWPREKVLAYFAEENGIHFDPRVVNVFIGLIEKGEI